MKICYEILRILFNNYYLFAADWKWLQVLLFNTNNSIHHYSFVCTQLNDSKYYNLLLTI